jgi:hypothetical protein
MVIRDIGWVPGVHVCFGSLHFITTNEGDLVWTTAPVPPPRAVNLNVVIETFGGLRLHPFGIHTPRRGQLTAPALGARAPACQLGASPPEKFPLGHLGSIPVRPSRKHKQC